MAKTPLWAVWGAQGKGFNPKEERHRRKKGKVNIRVENLKKQVAQQIDEDKNPYVQAKKKLNKCD